MSVRHSQCVPVWGLFPLKKFKRGGSCCQTPAWLNPAFHLLLTTTFRPQALAVLHGGNLEIPIVVDRNYQLLMKSSLTAPIVDDNY